MIELIENTGIQFVEIQISIGEDINSDKRFAEVVEYDENQNEKELDLLFPYKLGDKFVDYDSINAEAIDHKGEVIEKEIKESFLNYIPEEDIYKIRGHEPLDIYRGHWIPLPYFRVRNDELEPFHPGPKDWCRLWFDEVDEQTRRVEGCTHKIVLAFDTKTSNQNQSNYLIPNDTDATSSGNVRFKCVIKERFFRSFYSRDSVWDWLENIYTIYAKKITRKHKNHLRHFSSYFALLDILNQCKSFPEIALIKGENTIETGLVLDIGNSRTCGLIVETTSPHINSNFDFTSAKRIQIRDLSVPYKVYDEPFEMQVAFAEEKFGNEAANQFENVFQWPSLLRIGKEAIRLTSIFESEDSQATLSSPKRYLWDKLPSQIPWIKVDKEGQLGYNPNKNLKKNALYGIATHINNDGTLLKEGQFTAATKSNYSKSSLMTFALVELIFQTISQLNNHRFRRDLGNSSYKRVLKHIVVSCPTAMTKREQQSLKKAVENAIELVKRYFNNEIIHQNISVYPLDPKSNFDDENPKYWKFDEATCSQITYLYNELVEKYLGKHKLFFKHKGKIRDNVNKNNESLTIASIDIGGGTTDFMVCNYHADHEFETPIIKPIPVFWEGFNIAGGDIIKQVVEVIVFPSIERYVKDKGGTNVEETLKFLFGNNQGYQTASHRIYRRHFANQIAQYCAQYALELVTHKSTSKGVRKTIGEIFENHPKPKNNLIPYIENKIKQKCGVDEFNFLDIALDFDIDTINHAVIIVMESVIEKLIQLIAIFDCDIVLLSGRPSNLKVIREMFEKSLVLSPDKIVNFGDYKFGDWYPFASFGEVKDPKTTVSVGALIAFLNSINKLDSLRIDLKNLANIQSTADFIGVMNPKYPKIDLDKIIFDHNSYEGNFQFYGLSIPIGMRQLPKEEWIATPLYVFDFKSDSSKEFIAEKNYEFPFTITINRDESNLEELSINDIEIIDKNGEDLDNNHFTLFFKTLPEFEYWQDSGEFMLKDFIDN